MIRLISIILCLVFLYGCAQPQTETENAAVFYYCSAEDLYAPEESVFYKQNISLPDAVSLESLLEQYFDGPRQEGFTSLLPAHTNLLEIAEGDDAVTLTLSSNFASLTGIRRTLACAGIAATVFHNSSHQSVTILAGEQNNHDGVNVRINKNDLLFFDDTETVQEG